MDEDQTPSQIRYNHTHLTPEEIAEFRQLLKEREFSSKLVQFIRTYLPWTLGVLGTIITGLYWIATHFTFTGKP